MNRILRWSRSLAFSFLAVGALGQSVETVNGVRLVHNGKEGQWGKKPRVQVELVRTLGDVAAEDETVAFYMPAGMALDSQGNLYVLDTGNHRVQKFSPEGALLGSLPLDHFVDGIYLKGDRLFLWDAMRGAKFYEYRIKNL